MTNQTNERAGVLLRQRAERAIKFATQSKWEDAAQENDLIVGMFPQEGEALDRLRRGRPEVFRQLVDAYNRLGKSYFELGRYGESRTAHGRALELDANNAIARRNLQRLESLSEGSAPAEGRQQVDPDLFIEETGKTGVALLVRPDRELLQRMTAGDSVTLKRQGNALVVETPAGDYLGMIEARLALRLTRLIETGNEYAAAIAHVAPSGDAGRIIIKETRQSPENVGRLSFPTTGPDGVRPYTKESLLRYDLEDEDHEDTEAEGNEDWDAEAEPESERTVSFSEYERASETSDDEEFEE